MMQNPNEYLAEKLTEDKSFSDVIKEMMKEEVTIKEDVVNHPSHYESGKFECIEVMIEALGVEYVKGFCLCNAFKYIYRHRRKNGDEDIKKAQWYINKYLELSEGTGEWSGKLIY